MGGIEYFENLSELTCTGSESGSGKLTDLDLSSNRKLTVLDCSNNRLTMLNTSSCIFLRELVCDNNLLTDLIVIHNAALSRLFCTNNRLTTLDLSGSPYLDLTNNWYVRLAGNNLSTIKVRKGMTTTAMGGITIQEVTPNKAMIGELLCAEVFRFIYDFNGISPHSDMSTPDSTNLFERLVSFSRAREEMSLIDPFYAQEEKGIFTYYKGTSATTGEVVIDKIPFSQLDFSAFRNNRYDSFVEDGIIKTVGGFQNICNQLFNKEMGALFYFENGWPRVHQNPDWPTVLNAENHKAFCGYFKFVDYPPYIVPW